MKEESQSPPYLLWPLYVFAATAVASIALQNFIWVAVALFLFFQIRDHREFNWPRGLFPILTFLFLASFFAAALWGIDPHNSFLNARVHRYLTILLIFFVAAMPLIVREIQRLLLIFIYGAGFCALYGIVYKHFILHQDRLDSFSGDKMVFGGMLMVALLLNFLFLKQKPKDWPLWICAGLIAVALVFTQTRGAWIGCAIGLVILAFKLSRKWLIVGFLAILAAGLLVPRPYLDRLKTVADISFTYNAQHEIIDANPPRILIWVAGWKIIKDHPWGVGQGNVSELYPQYSVHSLARYEPNEPHLHNNYLQILAQNGWPGLIVYLFWILIYFREAWRFKPDDPLVAELNWTLLAVFASVLVWGLTEYTFAHQFMNVQFFLLGLQVLLWKNSRQGG